MSRRTAGATPLDPTRRNATPKRIADDALVADLAPGAPLLIPRARNTSRSTVGLD